MIDLNVIYQQRILGSAPQLLDIEERFWLASGLTFFNESMLGSYLYLIMKKKELLTSRHECEV